jgi:hypothetical protein
MAYEREQDGIVGLHGVLDQSGDLVGRVAELPDGSVALQLHYDSKTDLEAFLAGRSLVTERMYDFDAPCSVDDHRQCELATAIGMAADISVQEGQAVPPRLQALMDSGQLTESRVRAALEEWEQTVPSDRHEEAEEIVAIVAESRRE